SSIAETKSATFADVSRRSGKLPTRYALASESSASDGGSRVMRASSALRRVRTFGTSAILVWALTKNAEPYFDGETQLYTLHARPPSSRTRGWTARAQPPPSTDTAP